MRRFLTIRRRVCAPLVIVLATIVSLSGAEAESEIRVQDAWVQAPTGGRLMTSGAATIKNTGRAERVLVDVSAAGATAVELHEMTHSGGSMQMNRVKAVRVPPGGEVRLASGGLHLMLFGVKGLKAGDTTTLTLTFRDGAKIVARAAVR